LEVLLGKFNIDDYKPSQNIIPDEYPELKGKKFNITEFKQAIESLLYLKIYTLSDILFVVNEASPKSDKPTNED